MNAEKIAVGKDGKTDSEPAWLSLRNRLPGLLAALLSGLMNRAVLPGGYLPFGAGFMAAVPQKYAAAAAVGGVIGCLTEGGMLTSLEGLRHVSSLLAVGGIRWALGELRGVNRAKFYPFFAALAGVLMTGAVISGSLNAVISYSTLYFAIEGIMAGFSAMFFSVACRASERLGSGEGITRAASVSMIITVSAAAVPLCRMRLFGFSPGLTALHTAVLLISYARREKGGAAAGIAAGGVSVLAHSGPVQGTLIPFAALTAGYAAYYGRIFAASVYIAVCFLGWLAVGSIDYRTVVEAAVGGALSCLIPLSAAERLLSAAGFCGGAERSLTYGNPAAERLNDASKAIAGVCQLVGEVSDGLERRTVPDGDAIYRRAVNDVCGRCSMRGICAGDGSDGYGETVGKLAETLKKGRSVSGGEISAALGKKCVRQDEMAGEINRGYGYYLASRSAFSRMASIRSVVNGQLDGVGMMLGRLAEELAPERMYDGYSSRRVYESMKAQGFDVSGCVCRTERNGRTVISLRIRSRRDADVGRTLADCAGKCLAMDFEPESAAADDGSLHVTLRQRRKFQLICEGAQHCCGGETLCGDAYEHFEDGYGKGYILLSDGMGSGGRAAVEGTLTCGLFRRLLGGGFDFDSSVRIVNSALMIKSEDETLSTADCFEINLFDGRAAVSKAGAAHSYHVRNGFLNRIDLPSLPLGILCETDVAHYTFTAEEGDKVVMLSDGVPTDDYGWFEKILREYDGHSAGELASRLLESAVSRRPEGEDDDITVVVGTIVKNG